VGGWSFLHPLLSGELQPPSGKTVRTTWALSRCFSALFGLVSAGIANAVESAARLAMNEVWKCISEVVNKTLWWMNVLDRDLLLSPSCLSLYVE